MAAENVTELKDALFDVFGADGTDAGLGDTLRSLFGDDMVVERGVASRALQGLLAFHGNGLSPEIAAQEAMRYMDALEVELFKRDDARRVAENTRFTEQAKRLRELQEKRAAFG